MLFRSQQTLVKLNNTEDATHQYSDKEIQDGKAMGILAYIGILVLIPIFAEKNNKFVKYHANQGLILFGTEVIYWILTWIILRIFRVISWKLTFVFSPIFSLLGLVFLALMILGIVNVCNGKAKALPVIGSLKILN